VLEHAGDVAFGGPVDLWRTCDLDREVVLGSVRELLGDLERVREEVALGVTQVGAVEPYVALVEEAVEGEPASGRATSAKAGVDRQWLGTEICSQPSVSYEGSVKARRNASSERAARQVPPRSRTAE
jgi:hypothetical protein